MPSVDFYQPNNRRPLFWRLQWIGWSGTLVISVGMVLYLPMKDALLLTLLRAVFGFLVTSFLLRPLYQRMRRAAAPYRWSHFALLGLCSLGCGVGDTWAIAAVARWLNPEPMGLPGVEQFLPLGMVIRTVLYGFWSVLYFGIHYWLDTQQQQLHAARTEAALRAGELQMLRSQVNPHFLFNALNSILAATEHPPMARKITLALADYLRFSLQQRGDMERLGVEVAALESYLEVEKSRFEADLEFLVEVPEAALQTLVPVAVIQPLLENALKFGAQSTQRPLRVVIQAGLEGRVLTLRVFNSGHWVKEGSPSSTGTGLANLRRRLHLLYGEAASLGYQTSAHEVTATLCLPVVRQDFAHASRA